MQNSLKLNVILLGDGFAGKTCLLRRLFYDGFINGPTILGFAYEKQMIIVDQTMFELRLWDLSGCEKYVNDTKQMFCKYAQAAIIVYDMTFQLSFDNAQMWVDYLNERKDIDKFIVANKLDLANEAQKESALQYGNSSGLPTYLTSCKTGNGINMLLNQICLRRLQQIQLLPKQLAAFEQEGDLKLKTKKQSKKKLMQLIYKLFNIRGSIK